MKIFVFFFSVISKREIASRIEFNQTKLYCNLSNETIDYLVIKTSYIPSLDRQNPFSFMKEEKISIKRNKIERRRKKTSRISTSLLLYLFSVVFFHFWFNFFFPRRRRRFPLMVSSITQKKNEKKESHKCFTVSISKPNQTESENI